MKKYKMIMISLLFAGMISCKEEARQAEQVNYEIAVADSMLQNILDKYNVEKYGLLSETYPVNPENKVTYLAEGTEQLRNQEVSFLWPYSGILSGCISLYRTTGDKKYLKILEEKIIPGVELYWDGDRLPACYQSYPKFNGNSDRFYDDNDWIAIDFCDLYELTENKAYLEKAKQLYDYIFSGWDEKLGGGIYWCEQKKTSKNTCSNAPATVLCMKLYNITKDKTYLDQAYKVYNWTKNNLRDSEDFVYWDNITLDGEVNKAKYTYNSGQMILAGVMLYQESGDKQYLEDAQKTAKGAYERFTSINDKTKSRFYTASPWFNVILLRGLTALYKIDENYEYIKTMADNATYAWKNNRDKNGFLGNDWSGEKIQEYKWLLDNACMVELFSEIGETKL